MRTKRRTAVIPSANRPCRRVAILAVPPINELDVVGPFQVFGTVNRLCGGGGPPYEIEVVSSVREEPVHSIANVFAWRVSSDDVQGVRDSTGSSQNR